MEVSPEKRMREAISSNKRWPQQGGAKWNKIYLTKIWLQRSTKYIVRIKAISSYHQLSKELNAGQSGKLLQDTFENYLPFSVCFG